MHACNLTWYTKCNGAVQEQKSAYTAQCSKQQDFISKPLMGNYDFQSQNKGIFNEFTVFAANYAVVKIEGRRSHFCTNATWAKSEF